MRTVPLATLVWLTVALPLTPSGQGRSSVHNKGLTEVDGLRVGHYTLAARSTGCTVVVVDGEGAVGGVSQRGAAPGTRETDLLKPENLVDKVNAIVLAGGSALRPGRGAGGRPGISRNARSDGHSEQQVSCRSSPRPFCSILDSAVTRRFVRPPTAGTGRPRRRPTEPCQRGTWGQAPVRRSGRRRAASARMKGGVGSAAVRMPDGLVVGALVAVNSVGDVVDPATGNVVAGVRTPDGTRLADARILLRDGSLSRSVQPRAVENTTIAVVATNARLTKIDVTRMAMMADDGLARAIYPAHTIGDGDTVFSLATGVWSGRADASIIGALAADVLAEAIVRAAAQAQSLGGLPSARELGTVPPRFK